MLNSQPAMGKLMRDTDKTIGELISARETEKLEAMVTCSSARLLGYTRWYGDRKLPAVETTHRILEGDITLDIIVESVVHDDNSHSVALVMAYTECEDGLSSIKRDVTRGGWSYLWLAEHLAK